MTAASGSKPRLLRLSSFKSKLILLVALAVALPALATCVVLGIELNKQARTLFANGLQSNLETFSLLLSEQERNLVEGVRRGAADNTLQVTLDLEIKAQLARYVESQREVLGIEFLGAYDRNGRQSAAAAGDRSQAADWKLLPRVTQPIPCIVAEGRERQLIRCGGTFYVVAVMPILRSQGGLGDASAHTALRLGYLVGATPVAASRLLAALGERRIGETLIWSDNEPVHSSLPQPPRAPFPMDGAAREYKVGETPYLGAARSVRLGGETVGIGLLSPLAPLNRALVKSVTTVAAIGAIVVAVAVLVLGAFANRMLRPIQQLREGALRVGEGDLKHRIDVRTGDELKSLASQFNDMSGKLEESYANLEKKVEVRTHALRESLEQQTATAEVLREISGSRFELAPVFEAIVRSALRLCHAEAAFIFQRVDDVYRLVADTGYSPKYAEFVSRNPVLPGSETLVGNIAVTKETIHLADILDAPMRAWREASRIGTLRTMLGVPLMRAGQVLGVLLLGRIQVQPFSGKQIELVATFADQAVIAIENVRLLEEVRARTRELAQSGLRRFLAPQIAELLASSTDDKITLESHRCDVTVVFCDLRGFTAFAEGAEPEEVMAVLREYHASLGELIFRYEGTLERFVGDGLLVVFNDPLPIPDHPTRAVRMAIEMRNCMHVLLEGWRRQGNDLGFGIGIARGYATVGPIGFDKRLDYAVIGSVPNLASRLCDAAKPGQILVSQRVFVSLEGDVEARQQDELILKGFQRPVAAYEIFGWRSPSETND